MVLVLSLGWPSESGAYAVLAHEAIIDSAWVTNIRPLLLKRFPAATPEELKEAHGYAYGGAIIQDMGYYPHGSFFFSDLTHYVRSGDFVLALLHDSKDLDGYAFALGALAHYASDNEGHPIGTNRAVPLLYPKLKTKYGDSVTYCWNSMDIRMLLNATKRKPKDWAKVQATTEDSSSASGSGGRGCSLAIRSLLPVVDGLPVTEAAKNNSCLHRAPGGSWVVGIPTRWR